MIHIDIGVADNCQNPDSYGEICVHCNKCGRFDDLESFDTDDLMRMTKLHEEKEDGEGL